MQGDSNSLKILEVELDADEEIPQFVSFKGENYDKEFTVTDSSVIERIYSAFGQEAFYCIRSGKIGFSGTLIYDAKLEYAQRVHKEQRMLTRAYKTILGHWDMATAPILNDQDIEIEPIVKAIDNINISSIPTDVLKDLTANERREMIGFGPINDTNNEQQLLCEKLGVGGTQSMISVMSDVTLTVSQKSALLEILFGLTSDQVTEIFPESHEHTIDNS